MSFDLKTLGDAVANGPVARVVVVSHKGSAPREAGTSMLVSASGLDGTIGGGALELEAIKMARIVLQTGAPRLVHMPLGPNLGQCCGGAVSFAIERFDQSNLPTADEFFARPIENTPEPLALQRFKSQMRNGSTPVNIQMIEGWLIEPIQQAKRQLWLYGAGHVGRAVVDVLQGLDFDITWVDTSLDRFPENTWANTLVAENPALVARFAPADAHHLVMTYSHVFDLELCHQILAIPHQSVGLIGSKTKMKRFQARLSALGHSGDEIAGIICPIGDPKLGKEPKSIAIGVASQLIKSKSKHWARGSVVR